jgi:hypothetical protein
MHCGATAVSPKGALVRAAHRRPNNWYHTLQLGLALQLRPRRTCNLAAAHGEVDCSVEASGKCEDIYHFYQIPTYLQTDFGLLTEFGGEIFLVVIVPWRWSQ